MKRLLLVLVIKNENIVENHLLTLYAMHIISSIRNQVNHAPPDDVKMMASYEDNKLSKYFNVKNETVFNHEQDIVHYAKCPEESFPHDYVSKSGRRVLERVKDHNCKDTSSHIFQHFEVADH